MLRALFLGLGHAFSANAAGVAGTSAMLALGCFVGAWYGADVALEHWLGDHWLVHTFGVLATVAVAWFLLPPLVAAFVGLFLERVAAAVERAHYPDLPPAKGASFVQGLVASVRLLVLVLAANVALLVLLLVPVAYPFAWLLVNGFLLGREYFELVALRRLSPQAAASLRRRNAFAVWVTGCLVAAALLVPGLNLLAPIVFTAVMVHCLHAWRA
jgi:CysZ protein